VKTEQLNEILRLHRLWLAGDASGLEANLSGANLSGANLSWANLSRANLSEANLSEANLSEANLSEANLSEARLSSPICRMDFGGWSICIYAKHTKIGCQNHSNKDWLEWTPESQVLHNMHPDASRWWKIHGDAIKAAIRCVMAKAE